MALATAQAMPQVERVTRTVCVVDETSLNDVLTVADPNEAVITFARLHQ
jgi:hypothetical protein